MKHIYKLLLATILLGSCQTDRSQTDLNINRNPDELFLNTTPHKKMIVDVDMCTDVDDACALRIATALDDDGIIDLQGVAFSVNGPNNLDALRGFLLHEGKPDVLIGKSAVANPPEESPYWDLMAEYSDGKVDAYEAVKMYRKILAESDTPVDIVTTGYTTNIECLLKSEPDEYSELTGQELVKRKCGQLYVVGATYPEMGKVLRELMPKTFILVPGYGAQGGKGADLVHFFNEDGLGANVNSSRGIIAAYKQEKYASFGELNYADASRQAVKDMIEDISTALNNR